MNFAPSEKGRLIQGLFTNASRRQIRDFLTPLISSVAATSRPK
jgi:hypothetical protein